jgi:putative photosynthetic complex assembly protein 2
VLDYALPALFTLFIWWLSTGVVLYIVGRPRSTFGPTLAVMTLLAGLAAYGLYVTSNDTSVSGAYIAFSSALVLWGWHEVSFLTGLLTGPRKSPRPDHPPEPGPSRAPFKAATETVIHHELAILATVIALAIGLWDASNQIGLWTFVIFWLMRLSAKLNIYLGVRNLAEQFLPAHLTYLKSYFCRRSMNGLFPVSVTVATVVTLLLAQYATAADAQPFDVAGYTFLATLLALAVLEHWFLVMPVPADSLWNWGLASRASGPLASKAEDGSSKARTAVITG